MNGDERPVWPHRFPRYTFAGLALALVCGGLLVRAQMLFAPPLERFYLRTYALGAILPELPLVSRASRSATAVQSFAIVFVGQKAATEQILSAASTSASVRILELNPGRFNEWLRTFVYGGKSLTQLFRWPVAGFWFCVAFFGFAGATLDRSHNKEARQGRRLRGPALMSRWRFNLQTRGHGIAFRLDNPRNLFEYASGESSLRIRRDREAHHIQIAGDTGSGKSTLVREILYQVERRGETAIVFDPDREYIQEFFDGGRGDWVLNPKDDRCPYWPIGEECDDEATATPIANGLFPEEPTLQKFFLDHTRAIFAYLLATCRPTVAELADWMAHPEEIDRRVKGTEHEHTLTANAAPQRAGILGSMNQAGKPLRMMPPDETNRRTWTVRDWSKKRKGWIFITSTPDTLDALRPLQSLWLDMLILKLQSTDNSGAARVWMILDELAALNALPQLHAALTKQRKSDNPIVLGFQGMSQLDALYGKKAETILSQAYTNIVLRTREPRAAAHLSKLIGDAQIERVSESRPVHWFDHRRHSFTAQRLVDPVVMHSEIQGLEDLTGYFVQQNKVVFIRFTPRPKRNRAAGLIERVIPSGRPAVSEETPSVSAVTVHPSGMSLFVS